MLQVKTLFLLVKQITNHKYLELQTYLYLYPKFTFNCEISCFQYLNFNLLNLFSIKVEINRKQDHSGLYVNLNILGLNQSFNIYDIRHWDIENDCWEKD